jgi:hypothetical protein
MPIPPRLRPPTPSVEEFREYMELARQIEDGLEGREDVVELLDRWNTRASRPYSPDEFRYYSASTSLETFVGTMLLGAPAPVPDLTYGELREVVAAVMKAELPEELLNYFIEWLEANLPNANITNLIYWPNHWFGDESLLQVELTPDQILVYAMAKSGRRVPGAPDNVPMPYPIPQSS